MISNHPLDLKADNYRSLMMFMLALINYALMYAANIFLARALSVDDFDDYSVALSIVTILSTLATLGLEKYALRAIALFRDREDWSKFRGFWVFSLRTGVARTQDADVDERQQEHHHKENVGNCRAKAYIEVAKGFAP